MHTKDEVYRFNRHHKYTAGTDLRCNTRWREIAHIHMTTEKKS